MPNETDIPPRESHGTGTIHPEKFRSLGDNVVFEPGALVFHPENIRIGDNVYVGHYAILKGYHRNLMEIGDNTWIGQAVFLHSAGGLRIGRNVGIGPHARIITSRHEECGPETPVIACPVVFGEVVLEDDCDIGVGATLLPGVTVGRGAIVGAGAVVTGNVEPYTVVAGSPAKLLRRRDRT